MSSTYLVTNDGYDFKWLALQVDDFISLLPESYSDIEIFQFSYHNLSFAPWWNNMQSRFVQSEDSLSLPIPDISLWLPGAALVLSTRAYDALLGAIADFGELLPVSCQGETYYIFNCLTLGEVDEKGSKYIVDEGVILGVESMKFDQKDVGDKIIFKTTFNRCTDLYCNSTFKNIVESHNLTGITFKTDLLSVIDD